MTDQTIEQNSELLHMSATYENLNVTLSITTASLRPTRLQIDWGDGKHDDIQYTTIVQHTYVKYDSYDITATIVNSVGLSCSKKITYTLLPMTPVDVSETMYLIGADGKIIKPLDFINWRIVNTASKAKLTVTTQEFDARPGMFVSINAGFPYLFIVEHITSDDSNLTITGVDLTTAAATRRICITNTDCGDGYDHYDGVGGQVIPQILMRNCDTPERTFYNPDIDRPQYLPPNATATGAECHIRGRYDTVLSLYEKAVADSGLVVNTRIIATTPLICRGEIVAPRDTNVILSPDYGRLKSYSEKSDELKTTVIYEIGLSCPYKIASPIDGGDLWIGDTCYVDCGQWGKKRLRLSQYDIACSAKNDITKQLTFEDTIDNI